MGIVIKNFMTIHPLAGKVVEQPTGVFSKSAKQATTEKGWSVKHHCSGKAEFLENLNLKRWTSSAPGDLWTPESRQHFSTLNMTSPCRCWMAPCWWWPRRWRDQNCSSTARIQNSWTPHGPHPLPEMGCCDKHTHRHRRVCMLQATALWV